MPISDFFKINQFKKQIQELKNTVDSANSQLGTAKDELSHANVRINQLTSELEKRDAFIKCHLPIFEFSRLDFPASFEYLQKLWADTWGFDIHNSEAQLERQSRGAAAKYTPLDLSPIYASGHFRGLETDYSTTLVKCDCVDFQRRALPCKHMYRLAHEFDIFMLDNVKHHPDIHHMLHLNELKWRIQNLTSQSREILSEMEYDSTTVVNRSSAMPLIHSGLAVICEDKTVLLDAYKRDDLYNLLPEDATIRKNAKKMALIEYILANCPNTITELEKLTIGIELAPNISHLQSYMGRFL